MTHPNRHILVLLGRLALLALALAACAAPPAAPTSTPIPPPTSTSLPSTAAATDTAAPTLAVRNVPVPATSVQLGGYPTDIALDAEGSFYFSQCYGDFPKVEKVDPAGQMTLFAGEANGDLLGDGGPAVEAQIGCAMGMAFDTDGNLYVADYYDYRIRKIDRQGIITTVAGSGPGLDPNAYDAPSFAGDGGPATAALLRRPTDVAFDPQGNLYISDSDNFRIRMVDRRGIITTVVGNGTRGFAGDGGPASAAEIDLSQENVNTTDGVAAGHITFDADGNLYFADSGNGRVRMVDKQGTIHTVAGDGGPAVGGDGGPATAATLARPTGLAFDAAGNLYVASTPTRTIVNNSIRKIDRQGIITTVVGTGEPYLSGDGGLAKAATLWYPHGIQFDAQGNLYIIDASNERVRKVDLNGIITTVAGGAP